MCTACGEWVNGMDRVPATKVLFVLPRLLAGGLERVTLNLIDGLQAQGVHCLLAVGRDGGELIGEARALTRVEVFAEGGTWRSLDGLARLLARHCPSHVITAFADLSLIAALACRLARVRPALIVGVHGTPGPLGARAGWRGWLKHRLDDRVSAWLYPRADAVVAVSQGIADELATRYALPAARLHRIYSPVLQASAFALADTLPDPPAGGPATVVAVGRLAREKGFDLLIEAVALLRTRLPLQLRIYGEGAERAALQAQIDRLGLGDRVRLMGVTDQPLRAMAGARLLVFPSRHEGFGVTLVEAMACGQQIVAADCPYGPAEVLQGGRYGQLVPAEDPRALAEAIARSLDGKVHFDPAALRARARVFAPEQACLNYLRLLQQTSRGQGSQAG